MSEKFREKMHMRRRLRYYLPEQRNYEIEQGLINCRIAGPIWSPPTIIKGTYDSDEIASLILDDCLGFVKEKYEVIEDLNFVLVDVDTLNAAAITRGSLHCIALPRFYITSLFFGLCKLLSSNHFKNIWMNAPLQPVCSSAVRTEREANGTIFLLEGEADLTQDTFPLLNLCLRFLAFHEIAHIVNGHTRSGLLSRYSISETDDAATLDLRQIIRALEMDADAFAVQNTLLSAFECSKIDKANPYFTDLEACTLTALTCILVVLASLDTSEIPGGVYEDRTHPPSLLRSWGAMAVALAHTEKWRRGGAIVPKNMEALTTRASVGLKLAVADIGGCGFDQREHECWEGVCIAHDTANLKCWSEIRAQLETAKMGTHKLAPGQF